MILLTFIESYVASLPPEDTPGPATKQAPKQCDGGRAREAIGRSRNMKGIETDTRQLDVDLNYGRRKRRKSSSPWRESAEQQLALPALPNGGLRENEQVAMETREDGSYINCENSSLGATTASDIRSPLATVEALPHEDALSSSSQQSDLKPRKILRLNLKTGTIGSPPAKKSNVVKAGKNKKSSKSAQLVVRIKYGQNESVRLLIGKEIDDLLNGVNSGLPKKSTEAVMSDPPKPVPEVEPLKQTGPLKPTHPFFLGKAVPKSQPADTVVENPLVKVSSMLGEAKSPRNTSLQPVAPRVYSFGNVAKITILPGAVAPCWPPRDMLHIRGQEQSFLRRESIRASPVPKKSKYSTLEPSAKDDILEAVIRRLDIGRVVHDLKHANTDVFTKPEKCLRIPKRQFKTGLDIQRRVRRELHTRFTITCNSSEDELQGDDREYLVHPTLTRVYELIASTLSAFDRSEYEMQSWIHKYAPCSAADVLQTGKEALILREWLQKLTVISVHDGLRSRATSASSRQSSKPTKRKRKSKLEGFIISSDDEDDGLGEISEDEPRGRDLLKTVVRANRNKEAGKAVVISGPSGCGKTAMVYAVAKELGFEVFEINSSSRRSGRDVLEKVGDMTRNHLVNRGDDSDAEIKIQGPVNSFFGAKTRKHRDADPEPHKPLKAQKQSLILLEEVDILFDEDKQFWATVMTLIAQSKRPIVMTCNDEALVPLQALPLHAIIRLGPPPVDLAVDYMLLVAAAEGHIVQRQAVRALFDARQSDLRASMTELDYWCQFGVGDRRGGFDWFYPRWPGGCDVDAQGNTIRVVSDGTYATGMGWLGRDLYSSCESQSVREELFSEARDNWRIDVDMALEGSVTLSSYESYVDSLSLADLFASGCDYQVCVNLGQQAKLITIDS
jgi:ATPase family associated with various cellular activities (AAA)